MDAGANEVLVLSKTPSWVTAVRKLELHSHPLPTKIILTLCVQKHATKLPHFPRKKITPTEKCTFSRPKLRDRRWILRHLFSIECRDMRCVQEESAQNLERCLLILRSSVKKMQHLSITMPCLPACLPDRKKECQPMQCPFQ